MNDSTKASHGKQFATQMSDSLREQLLQQQSECTFVWAGRHEALATIMSFLWHDNRLWLTTNDSRPRVAAVRRTGRATAVVSSAGTALGISRCVTLRGPCEVLEARRDKDEFFPRFCQKLFPDNLHAQLAMQNLLDRDGQIILRLRPDHISSYDGDALMRKLSSL